MRFAAEHAHGAAARGDPMARSGTARDRYHSPRLRLRFSDQSCSIRWVSWTKILNRTLRTWILEFDVPFGVCRVFTFLKREPTIAEAPLWALGTKRRYEGLHATRCCWSPSTIRSVGCFAQVGMCSSRRASGALWRCAMALAWLFLRASSKD